MIAMTRTYQAAVFLLALVIGVLLVHGVSAREVSTSPSSAEALAQSHAARCQRYGGTPNVHYDLNADGSVNSITVTCTGSRLGDSSCRYKQGYTQTIVDCELVPGETEPSDHTTIGDGVLEEVEPTTTPVHGDLGGGTLDPTAARSSSPAVRSGTVATTVQADDEERP